jgi:outer membrane protein
VQRDARAFAQFAWHVACCSRTSVSTFGSCKTRERDRREHFVSTRVVRDVFARLIVASAVLAPSLANAQSYTLDAALAFARAHLPQIRAAHAALAARRADERVPGGAWLPRIGATAQIFESTVNNTTGIDIGVSTVPLYRISSTKAAGSTAWRPYGSTMIGVGATQELFDFGKIAAQRAIADASVQGAVQDERAEELDLERDVEVAFYAVRAASAVVASAQAANQRASVHFALAEDGVRVGMRPTIEVKRAGADLARSKVALARAQGGLEVARATLATSIGAADADVDVVVGDDATLEPLPTLADALARAQHDSPDVLGSRTALDAAHARTHELATRLRPDIFATASLFSMAGGATPSSGSLPSGDGFVPSIANWDVGVALAWPIFDGTTTRARDAARADEAVRASDVDVAKQRATIAVRDALVDARVADDAIASLQESADAARANDEEAEARFKGGVGTSVELADAEALRTDAEIQLAVGTFEQFRTRAILNRAVAKESPQ